MLQVSRPVNKMAHALGWLSCVPTKSRPPREAKRAVGTTSAALCFVKGSNHTLKVD